MKYKTIVVSDLHLGTPDAQPQKLLQFLEKHPCENLIINGDLVDGLYLKILGKWKNTFDDFFDELEKIRRKNQTKLIYIRGNHEIFIDKIAALHHFKIVDDMTYTSFGKKYYICHGHQFDYANRKVGILFYMAFAGGSFVHLMDRTYNRIRKHLGMKKSSLITPMKKVAHFLIGGKNKLNKKFYQKAIEQKCDGIICGHLHKAEQRKLGKIHYLNSGDRMENCTALVEDKEGNRKMI